MVSIAGFGIHTEEIKWISMLVFVCLGVIQYALTPDMNIFELLDKKVIGYPNCESVFCFAPSNGDIKNAATSFSQLTAPGNGLDLLAKFILGVVGLLQALWILFKGIAIILIFAPVVMFLYNTWYPMWGVGFGR